MDSQEEFLEEIHVKLSENGEIELRKAVVKGFRNSIEMEKKRNTEPGGRMRSQRETKLSPWKVNSRAPQPPKAARFRAEQSLSSMAITTVST